jgi:hypothetical protein
LPSHSTIERTFDVLGRRGDGAFYVTYQPWVELKTRDGEVRRLRSKAQDGPFTSHSEAGAFVAARVAAEFGS